MYDVKHICLSTQGDDSLNSIFSFATDLTREKAHSFGILYLGVNNVGLRFTKNKSLKRLSLNLLSTSDKIVVLVQDCLNGYCVATGGHILHLCSTMIL